MQPVVPTLHAIHSYTSAELNIICKVYEFKSLYGMMSPYTLVSGTKPFIVTNKDCQLLSLQFENLSIPILTVLHLHTISAFPIWYDIVWIVKGRSTSCGPQTEFPGCPFPVQIKSTFKEVFIFGKSLGLKFRFNFILTPEIQTRHSLQ